MTCEEEEEDEEEEEEEEEKEGDKEEEEEQQRCVIPVSEVKGADFLFPEIAGLILQA